MPLLQVTSFSIPRIGLYSCLSNKILLCPSCLSNSALWHINATTTDTTSSHLSTSATARGSSLSSQLLCRGQASYVWQRQAECEKKREVYYPNSYVHPSHKCNFFPGWDRRAPPCPKLPTLDLLVQFAIRGVRLSGGTQYFDCWFRNLFSFWKFMSIGCHSQYLCWTTTFSHRVLDHLPGTW